MDHFLDRFDMSYGGYMGSKRVASMLPLDYGL